MLSCAFLLLTILFARHHVSASVVAQVPIGQHYDATGIHRPRFIRDFHQPPMSYESFGKGLDVPSSFMKHTLESTAVTIAQDRLGLTDGDIAYTSGYSSETADYAYLRQSYLAIPFVNAVANLALQDGKIVSFGSSFVNTQNIAPPYPSVSATSAIITAEQGFRGAYNGHPTKLEYYAKPDSTVALVHVIQIQNDNTDVWVEAYVDAHSGDIVGSADFVAKSGYNVVPLERQSVLDGSLFLANPEDLKASPLGWHTENPKEGESEITSGNNVVSVRIIEGEAEMTQQSQSGLIFNYTYDTSMEPSEGSNLDAARTNAFYVINSVHDIAYRYGFTESAFNFQTNNFKKGGLGEDRVWVMVQYSGSYNDAKFVSQPDGQPGLCSMYLWNTAFPLRDGGLDNSVIVHEMAHGITNRMTGGGTARCLQTPESKGLGEGWSDMMADWTEQTSAFTTDFILGRYVKNKQGGARNHAYSVDPKVNPLRFSNLTRAILPKKEHDAGEIWANILHNIYAALVKKHGFSKSARTNPNGKEGNVVFLHLMLDALAIQPCNPQYFQARDALIQADVNRYKGANKCLLWKVFASRGLGKDAVVNPPYKDGAGVPSECLFE